MIFWYRRAFGFWRRSAMHGASQGNHIKRTNIMKNKKTLEFLARKRFIIMHYNIML